MLINYFSCVYGNADGFDIDTDYLERTGRERFVYECRCPSNKTKQCKVNNHEPGQNDECSVAKPLQYTKLKNGMKI
jgi:hypothetical protein